MHLLLLFFILSVLFTFSMIDTVTAESSYNINIPSGAASSEAPYFWQSEKDGTTNGIIEIKVADEVIWKNADTAAHTVTSGIPNEPNGIFSSGLFGPGKLFSYTFTEKGQFPYYCIVHPWMTGIVIVTDGFSVISNVGKNIGDGLKTFDVKYDFNGLLSYNSINESTKSITFEIIGNKKSNNNLTLQLPVELIEDPFVIWIDGKKISDFESVKDNDLNIVKIPITMDSKLITIVGTSVIPEFGVMSVFILVIAIFSVLIVGQNLSITHRPY